MKKSYFLFIFIGLISFSQAQNPRFKFKKLKYPYDIKIAGLDNDIDMAYYDSEEEKETLIFIHGLGSYLLGWKNNVDTLSQNYRCIVLDLPGYGKSSKGDYKYDMSFYSKAVINLMDKLNITQATLLGHSMGGQVSLTMALNYPERVKKLVLVSPAVFETFKEEQGILLKNFANPQSIRNTSDEKVKANLEANFYAMPKEAAFMADDRIAMKTAKDFDKYCQAVSKSVAGMLDEPVFNRLSEIKQPTLIIYGENDALIPNRFFNPKESTTNIANTAKSKIAGSQLVLVKEAGHFVHFEKPKETNAAILSFLK